jgi:hypothetical protein
MYFALLKQLVKLLREVIAAATTTTTTIAAVAVGLCTTLGAVSLCFL